MVTVTISAALSVFCDGITCWAFLHCITSCRPKKFRYVVYAILIHGAANAIAGIISLYVPGKSGIIISEVSIAICALLVFSYSFILKRKGV